MNGGKRPGAGRKKGNRKAEIAKELARLHAVKTVEEILGGGETPLEFLIRVMRDEEKDFKLRIEAAKASTDYCHRKQPQALEHKGDIGIHTGIEWHTPGQP